MKNLKNTFYILLLSVFFNFLAIRVQAQRQLPLELTWEKGVVVLTSGDTVRGSVVLRAPRDMIQVTSVNSNTRFYSPADVSSFDVSGIVTKNLMTNKGGASDMGFNFHYQTFLWDQDRGYRQFIFPSFFILVKPGNYSLLMRLDKETEGPISTGTLMSAAVGGGIGGYGLRRAIEQILEEKLYLYLPEGKLVALRRPKDDLKRIFTKNFKQIDDYAQTYNLRFNNTTDLAQIIGFANSLNP